MSFFFKHFFQTRSALTQARSILCGMALVACVSPACAQSSQDPIYVFHTNFGDMRVQLYPDVTPKTVANFLTYVNSGAYNTSFIHRSATSPDGSKFVIQGGGYTINSNAQYTAITENPAVSSEAHISNTRGTIAMALSRGPNTGTDQWFFNEGDNSALLDGTNDGGPFTVFGKVADSASLAVMDKIGAVQTYDVDPSNPNSPFHELPLLNYQSGSTVVYSNFVLISSITPAWTATTVAAGSDGNTRILWNRGDGSATVWTLNADGSAAVYSPTFGPIAGWTAKALSVGPDNTAHILWTNVNGSMTVWTLPNGSSTPAYGPVYGPIAGWTAAGIATSTNGTHVLWTNTNGAMTLWTLPTTGSPTYSPVFGPIAGWTAKSLAVDQNNAAHVLWTNTNGAMTLWTVSASGSPAYGPIYGPIAGWTATALSVDSNRANHVLWDNTDGRMTLWTLPVSGSPTYSATFGPYAGWSAVGVSVGVSNNSHVLWDNANGQMTPWTLGPTNQFVGSFPTYGPF